MRKARTPAKESKLCVRREKARHGTHLEALTLTLAPKLERWLGCTCSVHIASLWHTMQMISCKWNEGAGRETEKMKRRKGDIWAKFGWEWHV